MRTPAALSLLLFGLVACDGGPLPLQLEVRENASGHADALELFVKAEPDADLTFQGKTENLGNSPNHSFFIPKRELKLGKNMFTVNGVVSGFLSKRTGSATATFDVGPRMILHFQSPPGATEDATFACAGSMCAATSIGFAKSGAMPLAIMSDIAATVTTAGGKVTLAPGGRETVRVDLTTLVASTPVPPGDSLTLPITVEANGEKATDGLVLHGNGMTDVTVRELRKVEQGPLMFAGESASTRPPASLVVVGAPSGPIILVGEAKTFQDVDLVGVATPSERRFPCPSGAPLLYIDMLVKVYARRTGALVGTKSLSADRTTCPPAPAAEPLKSAVREDDTKRVLAEMLKK